MMKRLIPDVEAMEQLGQMISQGLRPGMQLHLIGGLGAGKTTLVRGILRGLGYDGTVKSPTYTLVESYTLPQITLYHFDFYRVKHPGEVEAIGFRDYRAEDAICLIEWPELAGHTVGKPDVLIRFTFVTAGRELEFEAFSEQAKLLITKTT